MTEKKRAPSARSPASRAAPKSARRSAGAPAPFLERTPFLEWLTAALGLAAAFGAIGFLVWEGFHTRDRSPVLAVSAGAITATPHGYVVDVEIRNESRVTATAVQVEGVLPPGPGAGQAEEEEVALTFDFVPGKGRREGSMTFRRDPRGQPLELQVRGQVSP